MGPKNTYGLDDSASRNAGQLIDASSFQVLHTHQDSVGLDETFDSVGKLPSVASGEGSARGIDGASQQNLSIQAPAEEYGIYVDDAEKLMQAVRAEEREKREKEKQIAMSDLEHHKIEVKSLGTTKDGNATDKNLSTKDDKLDDKETTVDNQPASVGKKSNWL